MKTKKISTIFLLVSLVSTILIEIGCQDKEVKNNVISNKLKKKLDYCSLEQSFVGETKFTLTNDYIQDIFGVMCYMNTNQYQSLLYLGQNHSIQTMNGRPYNLTYINIKDKLRPTCVPTRFCILDCGGIWELEFCRDTLQYNLINSNDIYK